MGVTIPKFEDLYEEARQKKEAKKQDDSAKYDHKVQEFCNEVINLVKAALAEGKTELVIPVDIEGIDHEVYTRAKWTLVNIGCFRFLQYNDPHEQEKAETDHGPHWRIDLRPYWEKEGIKLGGIH